MRLGKPGLVRLLVRPLRKLLAPVGREKPLSSPELPGVRLDPRELTIPRLGKEVVPPCMPRGTPPPAVAPPPLTAAWYPGDMLAASYWANRGSVIPRELCKLCVDRSSPVIRELEEAAPSGLCRGEARDTPARLREAAKLLGYDTDDSPPAPIDVPAKSPLTPFPSPVGRIW